MSRILLAGATGALGREVGALLAARGKTVRALTRDKARGTGFAEVHAADALDAQALTGAAEGADTVFSCLGASVQPEPKFGRLSYTQLYTQLDTPANLNLIAEAKRAGVKRFVYVSVFHLPQMRDIKYIRAHEAVVDALGSSGLDSVIIRPTGFFSALASLLPLAKGRAPLFAGGTTKSNPIHDGDLALVCADAIEGSEREVAAGGPEVLTRKEMFELAFAALGRPPKFMPAPLWGLKLGVAMMRPFQPRLSELMEFLGSLSEHDAVAPVRGTRTLGAYFKSLV